MTLDLEQIDPQAYVGTLLWRTAHAMQLAMDAALAPLELNLPQFAALLHLVRDPGLSTADLARLNLVSPQGMSMNVSRLEAKGLLERSRHRVHGRITELRPTQRGREVLAEALERVVGVEERLLSGLTAQERDALPDVLHRCLYAVSAPSS